jgi:aminoglycoside phosphotransferase (APT) family kinase protein
MSCPFPESKVEAVERALMAAFGTSTADSAAPLAGGLSGAAIYRIRVGGVPYLLRIEGARDAFRDPVRGYACMRAAASAFVAPRVRYADAADGVAIMDFIAERSLTLDYPGPRIALVTEAAQTLRALHETPGFPPLVDYMDGVAAMVGQLGAWRLTGPGEAAAELQARLGGAYRSDPADLVSSHNDLNPRNILYDGARLWLVDWESAFQADRFVDLACLANFLTSSPEEEETLLRVYFGRPSDEVTRARLLVMRQVNHLFYAMAFLSTAAPGDVAEAGPPALADLHRALGLGEFDLGSRANRLSYAESRLDAACAGMATEAFARAVRVLDA